MGEPEFDPSAWPAGVRRLIDEARDEVEELLATGRIGRAVDLVERTGVEFDAVSFPMYFTGALEARLVLIHLNAKQSPRLGGPRFRAFETYFDAYRRFGYHHWGQDPTYRSAFDHKQVQFLRPFEVIDFLPETDPRGKRKNPELALDGKLQLELVPYASPTFPTHPLTAGLLRPHFDRVLDAVAVYQRDYVLFCGVVFDELLERSGVLKSRQDHRFRLPTSTGMSKAQYGFSTLVLEHEGIQLRAGLARSFAVQGLPMTEYARKVRELY